MYLETGKKAEPEKKVVRGCCSLDVQYPKVHVLRAWYPALKFWELNH